MSLKEVINIPAGLSVLHVQATGELTISVLPHIPTNFAG